mmetsp:Transcript_17550/g.36431  ORF Transcript_17550/g.36431 Transcript_17550/m.36431 type:complete len:88 (-) Transcript_17550:689-952(-)
MRAYIEATRCWEYHKRIDGDLVYLSIFILSWNSQGETKTKGKLWDKFVYMMDRDVICAQSFPKFSRDLLSITRWRYLEQCFEADARQ